MNDIDPKTVFKDIKNLNENSMAYCIERVERELRDMFAMVIVNQDHEVMRSVRDGLRSSENSLSWITERPIFCKSYNEEMLLNTIRYCLDLILRCISIVESKINPLDEIENGKMILDIIKSRGRKGISFYDVAKYSTVTPGATQRAIDKLISYEYIRKVFDELFLTKKGDNVFEK